MNRLMVLGTAALVAIAACSPDSKSVTGLAADRAVQIGADAPGAVYALTNQATDNAVAVLARRARWR